MNITALWTKMGMQKRKKIIEGIPKLYVCLSFYKKNYALHI